MFKYCVVKNVEHIEMFKIIKVYLMETLCSGEKSIYLNSGEFFHIGGKKPMMVSQKKLVS